MARYYGTIGFSNGSVETSPGVWDEVIVKRQYYGDVTRNNRRLQSGEHINDNITISNEISIVSDPYALQNFHAIRYISWMGTNWKVSSVEVRYPRLILSIGDEYHGPTD